MRRCDKCCFIDLILAPFLPGGGLRRVFGGAEPLADPALLDDVPQRCSALTPDAKPWECVGDVGECRAAVLLAAAAAGPGRGNAVLATLVAEVRRLRRPAGRTTCSRRCRAHHVPERYAPDTLLV